MSTVKHVLILGGGIAGMSLAISLAKAGIAAEIVEADKDWRVYGAGISITGPSLRAFKALGIIDRFMAEGYAGDGFRIFDHKDNLLAEIPTQRVAGPDIPGGGGIMRPVLHKILSETVLAGGTKVRLGLTAETIMDEGETVSVRFNDGSQGRYDLVVGADGVFSKARQMLFPDAPKPRFTGQSCWRLVAPRPVEIAGPAMYSLMGTNRKAGLNPVSQSEMYMFVLTHEPTNPRLEPARLPDLLAERLAGFEGIIGRIRDGLGANSTIVYRPLETVFLERPWHRGRILLIGDAAHATTPHLASGAGIAVEDGLVLTELLQEGGPVEETLDRFEARRYERCRMVVQNSVQLGDYEMAGQVGPDHAALMGKTMGALNAPI